MSAETLIFLLLIGGSLLAMTAMHRGGTSGRMGMGCCGGHGSHEPPDTHSRSGEPPDDASAQLGSTAGAEPQAPASERRGS